MKLHCNRKERTSRVRLWRGRMVIYMYSGDDLGGSDFWATRACNRKNNWQFNLV